ncbi:MAG: hypothetical protein N0A16_00695 [Blastocatellia bacterium]|nr:hypothetical protein [Blastocatellia bacterium]MCS7156230.1 hypothetical protein [Blastocatellia bacterium]MCX7751420.1 hypothetical protein [Blastocatellia bacterium]MDW8169133.1 hypothetical protein [Acidobacteriota bacterium]MDW8255994.1 hypothetical protein [Acidobacteriota bacterium]
MSRDDVLSAPHPKAVRLWRIRPVGVPMLMLATPARCQSAA